MHQQHYQEGGVFEAAVAVSAPARDRIGRDREGERERIYIVRDWVSASEKEGEGERHRVAVFCSP
jgi:hypothetical protein